MSPAGGVGINLVIQDAVAAANTLAGPIRKGTLSTRDRAKIQGRREFSTRITQPVQALIPQPIGGSLDVSGPRRASGAYPRCYPEYARVSSVLESCRHVKTPYIFGAHARVSQHGDRTTAQSEDKFAAARF
jgi:hypothetical protein